MLKRPSTTIIATIKPRKTSCLVEILFFLFNAKNLLMQAYSDSQEAVHISSGMRRRHRTIPVSSHGNSPSMST